MIDFENVKKPFFQESETIVSKYIQFQLLFVDLDLKFLKTPSGTC